MKMLWLSLILIAYSPFGMADDSLQQLQDKQKKLEKSINTTKESDNLILALRFDSDWLAIPIKPSELNAMLNIMVQSQKMTPQDAIAAKQDITNFTNSYQQSLQEKLNEVKNQILEAEKSQPATNTETGPQTASKVNPPPKPSLATKPAPMMAARAPTASTKPPQVSEPHANVTIAIDNLKQESNPGYRKWTFDYVLTEHNGIGVRFNKADQTSLASIDNGYHVQEHNLNFRLEGKNSVSMSASMFLETTNTESPSLHEVLRTTFHGVDDHGNPVNIDHYLLQ